VSKAESALENGFISGLDSPRLFARAMELGDRRIGCAAGNRWLRDARDLQIPVIYFLGVAPGLYQALLPTFIIDWNAASLRAKIAFAASDVATSAPESVAERRYALRQVKQRLHQASFRQMVISAYDGRCAISGLPEPLLLDAAHIVDDGNEKYGQPIVSNGIPLSKIHHAAFDAHLIGIDPDFRIHVSRKLLGLRDGPTLEALRHLMAANCTLLIERRTSQTEIALQCDLNGSRLLPNVGDVY
jgi:putative restriction endonuclease